MKLLEKLLHKFIDPNVFLIFLILTYKLYFIIQQNSLELYRGVFLTNVFFLLLIMAPAYLFTARPRRIYLLLCDLVLTFIMLADLLYLRFFGSPISIVTIFQVSNLAGLGPSIGHLVKITDLLYILDLLLLPLIFYYGRLKEQRNVGFFVRDVLIALLFIAFLVRLNYLDGRIFIRYSAHDTLRFWGPLGYHVMDTTYFIQDRSLQLTPEVEEEILAWYDEKDRPEDNSKYKGIGAGKNLIVIQLESFQNFVVGLEIDGQYVTPNLNKLVENSLYFPHYYPQTIKGNSSDAELLSLASIFPVKEGSTFFRYPQNKYEALPQMLNEKGYHSIAIHGDEAAYWNRDKVYPQLGFAQYYAEESLEYTEEVGMGLSDEAMFAQTVTILKEQPQPFFAFVVTLTSHYPFWMPMDKILIDLPAPLSQSHLGNYLRSINYSDYALGEFLEGLEEEGLLENTVIALYGDHDGVREQDREEIATLLAKREITDEDWIRDYVPVPLLLYTPKMKGEIMEVYGGQVDFLPTIACLMGIEPPWYRYAMGTNLLAGENEEVIVPGGDYIKQTFRVSQDSIVVTQDSIVSQDIPRELRTLDIADRIIRTNFIARTKSQR
ncbi:MAG: hypothetical protein CVU87_06625 [Firmicutes bacterium HGW-Firmicutes-12]|nr:MAG: hypothetical protein CVU87_06625 [Firmicutes bacterium HGW-Firmicutes-12]